MDTHRERDEWDPQRELIEQSPSEASVAQDETRDADAGAEHSVPTVPAKPPVMQPSRSYPSAAMFLMVALLLGKIALARWQIFGPDARLVTLLLEAPFVIVVLGIFDWLLRRWRFAVYVILDVVLSCFLLALIVYVTFYDRMMAPAALKLAGQAGAVLPSVLTLLKPVHLLFVIDVPLLLLARPRLGRLVGRERAGSFATWATTVSLLFSVVLAAWLAATPLSADSIPIAKSHGVLAFEAGAVTRTFFTSRLFGLNGAQARADQEAVAAGLDYASPASVQSTIENTIGRVPEERIATFSPGDFAGADVIIVQVESLQRFAIDEFITPHIDELRRESWYFPNGFAQTGLGTTSDAEFAMNTSLYPPVNDPASVAYVDRRIPSLPRLLASEGYYSFTMHANTSRFWNRKELYPALGFSDFYDRTYFGTENVIGMGASDRQLFSMALPVIAQEAARGPIYCQLITLSPHRPFEMPASTIRLKLPEWLKGSIVGNYLEAMDYEDRQIGWLVDQLKVSGLWDDTIFVVYGDHAGLRASDFDNGLDMEKFETILGHTYTPVDRANIPILIHLPGQKDGVYCTSAVGQIDIMPTIADALGLDISHVPHFGRSMFETSRTLLAGGSGLPPKSFVNDRILCVAGDTFDTSRAYSVQSRVESRLLPYDRADWDAAQTLRTISDTYVRRLPKRRDSEGASGAIIPDKTQKDPADW